jgi:hypothetical protein
MGNFMAVMNNHIAEAIDTNKAPKQERCNYQDNYYGDRICKVPTKDSKRKKS